ncbi:MAG: MarR family winged helix-turn-helix transcriptional regulator [Clostridia bacterium]
MEKYGLKSSCGFYLIALKRYSEGITAARLAEITGRDKADVSRSVTELAEKGFLRKKGVRYRALLLLTEEGEKVALNLCERAARAVEAGGRGLSEEQRVVFYEKLEQIARNMKELSRDGIPEDKPSEK